MGNFYICPTPIGNLEDISYRTLEILKNVDVIFCEDTRRSRNLLNHFEISTPLKSFFLGNEFKKNFEIHNLLNEGVNIALISDAGTPLVSDPGDELIKFLISHNHIIISVPGPSSVLTALTVSGFNLKEFQFLGFIPKSGKEKLDLFVKLMNASMPSVCFTSPKRVKKDLQYFLENGLNSDVVVCRELTKKFETIYRGKIEKVLKELPVDVKGEITLVFGPSEQTSNLNFDLEEALKILLKSSISKRDIAKSLSLVSDYSVNELYEKIKDF